MSMPIQRQSEAFGVFDDGPRFARDRGSHDLPRGLAGLVNSMGPRITGGLLDTRTAGIPDDDPMPVTPEEEDQWEAEQAEMARRNRERNRALHNPPSNPDWRTKGCPDCGASFNSLNPEKQLAEHHCFGWNRQGGLLNTRQAGTDSYPTPEHLWEGQGPDRDENGRPLRNSNPSEVEHFSDAARALRSAGYPRTAAPQADAAGATSGDAMSALTNYGIEPPTMNVGGGVSTSIPGAVAKMVWNGSSTTGQEATPAFNPGPAKTGGWHSDFDPSARLRIRRAGMECEYCGKPGHDWTRHPEAHADVAAWEREKHLEEFPFGDYTESPYPADDEHGGEAWPGRNASRRTAGDGPGPGGVDDLMFPNHRQPTGADYLAEMDPEDRPGYGEDGSGWCKHCEETITEKGMGYAHYDGHNRIGEPNYYESDHPAEPEDDDDLDDRYPAYRPSTARRAGYPSDGPRDHGGAGPDGGPSVPDWYYQDDDDFDGDPKDPPGTPMEDPWGHGGRRASRHPFDRAHLAGDGMSWEDTMAHIDQVLAEGEPRDRSDYSTDYYHDGYREHGVHGDDDDDDPYDHRRPAEDQTEPPHPDQDWQQTPDYDTGYVTEQHHKVQDGRHVLVEHDHSYEDGVSRWTWQHFDGNPFGMTMYPNASGSTSTKEEAMRAGDMALNQPIGDGHWSDMRHHGWDPMDQGDPLTYRGDPEFANIHHPNYHRYMEQRGLQPRIAG
jgi:hypothetical protein